MSTDYLNSFSKYCDIKTLTKIWDERSKWIDRDSAKQYKDIFNFLPKIEKVTTMLDFASVHIGKRDEVSDGDLSDIKSIAEGLIPWRKGPFNLFGLEIDAEWKSNLKWDRISPTLEDLKGKTVLDIGSNNGYFLFRMAERNPALLLGIDPVLHVKTQFDFLNHYAKVPTMHHGLLGIEHMNLFNEMFDVILSMGIIYHHRHPLQQLLDMKQALKPGGQLILETIGIPGEESVALCPEDRYANMKNVFFIPTLSCLVSWLKKAKFGDIEIISDSEMTTDEQRLTDWCPPPHQSFQEFLDPNDPSKTKEGHPAPKRFAVSARKKKG